MQIEAMEPRVLSRPSINRRPIGWWLLVIAALIFAMVILGGVTRLTNSGLSIVEWQPVSGVVPPLDDQAWQVEFDKYRQYPEYQKKNRGMSLAEFKRIYAFEYAHRLLGRVIGVAFAVPFLYFLLRGRISPALAPQLFAIFLLGAAQGGLGWFMVRSGLVDRPDVSQYRLAAHLGLAVAIYGYVLWVAFSLLAPGEARSSQRGLGNFGIMVVLAIVLQMLLGALVAGLDAGFVYNTWPLMEGSLVPSGLFPDQPWWRNAFEDIMTVQFDHRIGAYLIAVAVVLLCWRAILVREFGVKVRFAVKLLLAALLLQIALGVATLLYVVPVPLAAAHQAGALLLLSAALWLAYRLRTTAA